MFATDLIDRKGPRAKVRSTGSARRLRDASNGQFNRQQSIRKRSGGPRRKLALFPIVVIAAMSALPADEAYAQNADLSTFSQLVAKARQGDPERQKALADAYAKGDSGRKATRPLSNGTARPRREVWGKILGGTSSSGTVHDNPVKKALDNVTASMTPDQIAEAEALAREWRPGAPLPIRPK